MPPPPKSILITGASSGIGAALARHYAQAGVTLFLGGRDAQRLEAVAADCRARGAEAHAHPSDVADAEAMRAWVEGSDATAPLNLVVANAGIALGATSVDGLHEAAVDSFAINVGGILNVVHPAVACMAKRGQPVTDGQIAIMSSIMGYVGVARSPAYSYSKGTARLYGQSLRGALRHMGVRVSVICPGYVDTPLNQYNTSPMPFMVTSEKAAEIIAKGLARNKGRITFPWQIRLIGRVLHCLPNALVDRINIPWGRPPLEGSPPE